jgi:hypothetical protein
MKAMKTTLIATAAIGLVAAIGTQFGGVPAFAQAAAPAAAPAPAVSNIPVHAGNFTGGKVDSITYTPSCPAFKFDMDAAAIQESTSRAYVEGEKRRFDAVREKWDAYEDCLVENARRDIDVVRISLGDYLSAAANEEAKAFNGMNAAATGNIERIGKLPAPKASKKKGDAAAAEAPQAALSAWTEPKTPATALTPCWTSCVRCQTASIKCAPAVRKMAKKIMKSSRKLSKMASMLCSSPAKQLSKRNMQLFASN